VRARRPCARPRRLVLRQGACAERTGHVPSRSHTRVEARASPVYQLVTLATSRFPRSADDRGAAVCVVEAVGSQGDRQHGGCAARRLLKGGVPAFNLGVRHASSHERPHPLLPPPPPLPPRRRPRCVRAVLPQARTAALPQELRAAQLRRRQRGECAAVGFTCAAACSCFRPLPHRTPSDASRAPPFPPPLLSRSSSGARPACRCRTTRSTRRAGCTRWWTCPRATASTRRGRRWRSRSGAG
jgi:hypothetical protein